MKKRQRIIRDDSIATAYGEYRCPECKIGMYWGANAFHEAGCSLDAPGFRSLDNCDYYVGKKNPKYAVAE